MTNIEFKFNFQFAGIFRLTRRHKRISHHIYTRGTSASIKAVDPTKFPVVYIVQDYKSLYKGALTDDDFNHSRKNSFKIVPEQIRKFGKHLYRPVRISRGSAISNKFADKHYLFEHELEWKIKSACESLNKNLINKFQSTEDIEMLGSVALEDNLINARTAAQNVLKDYLFCDGKFWVKTDPPVYHYNTFGLGGNHGGTGLFIGFCNIKKQPKSMKKFFFLPTEREKAIETVTRVAADRGDTKDVKRFKHVKENIIIVG